MNIKTDVVIVGAGPGGALLGYLLAKNNISTIVLERNPTIDKEFRGEHINEAGESILKKHNLFHLIQNYGLLFTERIEYWNHGKMAKTIFPSVSQHHFDIHVPQNHLLKVLISEAKQYSNYQLYMNTIVNELIQDETGRYIGVRAKCNGEQIEIRSSLVIAADGRFSTVRKLAGVSVNKRKHGYDLLWAKIPAPSNWEPTIRFAMVDGKQVALFTQEGGYIQIGWNINEGIFSEIRKQSFEPFINKLLTSFPILEEQVRTYIRSWDDFVYLSVFSSTMDHWIKDNSLIFIGDAAHTMSPTGAFGINSSLKDADKLAELIQTIDLVNPQTGAFQTFEESRKEEVANQQAKQLQMESSFKKNFLATISSN